MPSIIDALVITLGFDTKGLKKGEAEAKQAQSNLRNEAERTRKAFEESNRRVAESITSARNAAVGLFGVMTAGRGINSLVSETTQASAALGRMARNLNVSTEALSAYEGVSRQVGNSAGQVTSALEATQNQIQQFRLLGASMPSMPVFRSLGIALADSRGNARETTAIYNDVLDALHRRPAQERATLAAGLGYGQETVNLAAVPAAQRQQMLAQARADSPTAQSTAAAARREAAWVRLDRAIMRVTDQILLAMTPTIEFVVEQLGRLASFLGEHALAAFTSIEGAVRRFAGYIGSQDFQDDMAAFIAAIRDASAAMLEWLRWLGIVARPAAAGEPPAVRGPDGTMNWVAGPNGVPVPRPVPAATAAGIAGAAMGGVGGNTGTPTTSEAAARERQAYDFFRSAAGGGYTHEQASGLVANIRQESNFNPNATHDGGIGFGIAGWNGTRLRRLGEFIQGDPRTATFEQQLAFAAHELSPNGDEAAAGARIRATTTPNDAGQVGSGAWLRPRDRFGEMARRGAMAEGAARRLAAPSPPAPTQPSAEAAAAALGVRVPRAMSPAEAEAAGLGVRIPPAPDPALVPGAEGATLRDNVRPNQTSSNETSIGAVTVVTQATDAGGIARDFASAVRRMTFVDQATEGLA